MTGDTRLMNMFAGWENLDWDQLSESLRDRFLYCADIQGIFKTGRTQISKSRLTQRFHSLFEFILNSMVIVGASMQAHNIASECMISTWPGIKR